MVAIAVFAEDILENALNKSKQEHLISASVEILESLYDASALEKIYAHYNLQPIKEDEYSFSKEIYKTEHTFGEIVIYEKLLSYFLEINYLDEQFLFKLQDDTNSAEYKFLGYLLLGAVAILLLIYFVVLKIVSPINRVAKEIENFSKGDFSARVQTSSNDEVARLAHSFNHMAKTIQDLIQTKEELLRDVGHELKTPIAKLKFSLEDLEESKTKEMMKKNISLLDRLTEEVLEIKKLSFKELAKEAFSFETLFLESVSSLVVDEERIALTIHQDKKITGDLYYLSIALKNLIENAIKYGSDATIAVTYQKQEIVVASKGKSLDKDLEYYLQPFTRESINRDKKGFGLGLSIVKKILDRHEYKLVYHHNNGENIFTIVL